MASSILIVDDEAMIRENLKAYLEDEGMQVIAVESGEEALRCVKNGGSFAVCIMDMRLPGMDGNASIRSLHALCPDMKFIVHTGSSDYTLPGDLRKLGLNNAQVYLKPLLDMAPLAATVRALMRRRRSNSGS
jgi:DNA-binding NtrC family response regulator